MGQGYGKVFGPLMAAEVKPLTELHISDIRKAHSVYINLEVHPGVSAPQFAQIFGCLRSADRTKVFKFFATGSLHKRVDINEVLAVAILTATAFVSVKIRVLFQLYDLDDSSDLSMSECVMMLASAVRGLCRCTYGCRPSALEVEMFSAQLFKKIDIDADDRITEGEWSAACARDQHVRACLNRFCRRDSVYTRASTADGTPTRRPTRPSGVKNARNPRAKHGPGGGRKKKKIHQAKGQQRKQTRMGPSNVVMRDVKREVRMLRETFEAIDEDKSQEIDIDEFLKTHTLPVGSPGKMVKNRRGSLDDPGMNADDFHAETSECGQFRTIRLQDPPKKKIPPHILKMFEQMDEDGDGKITWPEILRVMFASYGKAVVDEILSWPIDDYKRLPKNSAEDDAGKPVHIDKSHELDLKQLFDVYDKNNKRDIPIFYLARRMSELHGVDEGDLLHIFETAGQEPRDLVDAETYVELIKFLLAGDSSMASVIDLLKLRS